MSETTIAIIRATNTLNFAGYSKQQKISELIDKTISAFIQQKWKGGTINR